MSRLACMLGRHDWRVRQAAADDPMALAGYPVRTPLVCQRCGITMKCGLCGRRHD